MSVVLEILLTFAVIVWLLEQTLFIAAALLAP